MSRGPETTFIGGVHKHLPKEVYRTKVHNVYNAGIADCWYDGPRSDLWIEYKFIVLPKRGDTVIDLCGGKNPVLSQLQQQWLRERSDNGRNVVVIVGHKGGGVWFEHRTWEIPRTGFFYEQLVWSRQAIAAHIESIVYG